MTNKESKYLERMRRDKSLFFIEFRGERERKRERGLIGQSKRRKLIDKKSRETLS